jgi:hypothetical protein
MSAVSSSLATFTRALADLETVLKASEGWKDDQRTRLERGQLAPLRAAANRFAAALGNLEASLNATQRLLSE